MANEKDYIPEGSGPNGEFQEGDDLKKESKNTLGSYLSKITHERNHQPISDSPRIETSLTDSNKPAEFETGGQDGTESFTKTFASDPKTEGGAVGAFETLSNSGKFSLGDFLDKNAQRDGHDLLRSVKSNSEPGEPGIGNPAGATALPLPAGAAEVQKQISAILQNGNRFDPTPGSSPYIEDGRFTEPGIPITQGEFGVYNDSGARTTIEELKKVAHALMVKQTGERLGKGTDPDGGNTVLTTGVQRGADLLGTNHTRPINAFGAPDRVSLEDSTLTYNDVDGKPLKQQKSYGAMTSYREDFENSPISNITTAVGAFGEFLIGALIFTAILTLVEVLETGKPPSDPASPTTLKKGQFVPTGQTLRLLHALGIPSLDRPAWLCLIYGIAAFFAIPRALLPDPSGGGIPGLPAIPGAPPATGFEKVVAWFTYTISTGSLVDIFENAMFGAGYYSNMTRVMRRDLNVLVEDIDFSDAGSGIASLFRILTSLNSYNSWNFFTAMLKMGEVYLDSYSIRMPFNKLQINGQTRQILSRQSSTRNELAWRHRSSPALVLLNEKYNNAMVAYGFHENQAQMLHNKIGDAFSRSTKSPYYDAVGKGRKGQSRGTYASKQNVGNRFTREQVIEIENELDSEYCPFYFHDLRTNEVMGFQAFLSDVKDSYSVSYAESGGYGRIDKVKIYQDTTRSISVSWTMVATSPEDFDSMWYSVNKLISMIYPQFSMGKQVKSNSKKFIMPFSQIPTASPVIRLRIGDIVRSNYSRFNLARIFGLSEIKPAPPGGGAASVASSAPFDLTAGPARESARAKARKEDRKKYEAAEEEIKERFANFPSSPGDDKHGFVPGDPNWGKAILLPSSAGYLTYDTNAGKVVPLGSTDPKNAKNIHSNNSPPDGAIKVESTPFKSRPSTEGVVKVYERIIAVPSDLEALGVDVPQGEPTDGAEPTSSYPIYFVQYEDPDDLADPYADVSKKKHFHTYVVTTDALRPIIPEIKIEPTATPDPTISLDQQITDIHEFFDPKNNAIVRSFEAAGGRGLAGVITSFDMDWNESQWDMSAIGRRAPTMIKCSIAFSPIHDIIPGLDNNGMPRAMNYPVGNIAGPMGTDFHDPGGITADTPGLPKAKNLKDASKENRDNFTKSRKGGGEGG